MLPALIATVGALGLFGLALLMPPAVLWLTVILCTIYLFKD